MYFKFLKLHSCGKRSGDHRRRLISGYVRAGGEIRNPPSRLFLLPTFSFWRDKKKMLSPVPIPGQMSMACHASGGPIFSLRERKDRGEKSAF